jgi:c-di-AMP phosphodiesterase-like protein
MRRKINAMRRIVLVLIILQAAALAALAFLTSLNVLTGLVILALETVVSFYLLDHFEQNAEAESVGVRSILGDASKDAFLQSGVGMLIYDDSYEITWMSELFAERNLNKVGHKLLTWLPEADELISGKTDKTTVQLDDRLYEIQRKENAQVIFFRDITELSEYRDHYRKEQVVIGLASFDNYEESTQYEDEADAAAITATVRAPLTEYCQTHGILLKRLNTSRYLLVLNEDIFAKIAADHFSVLAKVRKAASKIDVTITLSMAFARGSGDFAELDDMVSNLMDLAQTRGGDQVTVQVKGEEVHYFGGSTEATEKRSRVRVRVMSYALRDLILRSRNVIICGHKTADFDCIGSAICLSRMSQALGRPAVIIAKTGGIEEKLAAALKKNEDELKDEVSFVTEGEALNQLNDDTLVILTDHHNVRQTNGPRVLEKAKRTVVIDHHRRSTEMGIKPVLVYIEAGASSTCELLTEMIPYVSPKTDISATVATIMLTGMIVDTHSLRTRTGSRTYDAASALRELGADPQTAYAYLKDSYDEFALKTAVATHSERYDHGVVIASVTDRTLSRSLMSQVADSLLNIEGVEASFVIGEDDSHETCISARSAGRINVQMIMEKMGGGGHMTAAAMQRNRCDIGQLKQELLDAVHEYFKEEVSTDESDSEE